MAERTMFDQAEDLKAKLDRLFDRARHEAIALILAQSPTRMTAPGSEPEWMTATQLARYWQLVNPKGEPTTAGIVSWVSGKETLL